MNAEIIAVGSELLLGQIANTNGQYLSAELAGIGINVYRHTVVGDNKERLKTAIKEACERADFVLLTGGLGPTEDDLTKETVSEITGAALTYHTPTLEKIKCYFEQSKKRMSPNNKKQAHYTEGSEVFYNRAGMACGMALKLDGTRIILLPGPPRELKTMYWNDVKPYLLKEVGGESLVLSRVLRFFGIGESSLEEELIDLIQAQTNPTIAPLASDGEVSIRLTAKVQEHKEGIKLLDNMEEKIKTRVGKYMYGREDETLPFHVVRLLKDQHVTIAAAESITGGWFSKALVDISGASSVLTGSATTYSLEAKERVLGIERSLLSTHGAVSKECAEAMAEKARLLYGSDLGISFTGVAGPDALEGHQPGTVWIGLADSKRTASHVLHLAGGRDQIRRLSVYYGCWHLLRFMKN
ncbi:competence/damage-inducible protein A [Alteribacillus iranensis]|uniref:Putative competence-damage inducible protein n=1 Tax=Alteribacillus iranensis TaxID=930128 RepID=A0A1I2A1U8_9BACI|nr:competence/damage-inducible protein A [Alteribacillus iranensis]SFE37757.1 competence/damage-inducible protein cinA [Alteribacillus iranensis]